MFRSWNDGSSTIENAMAFGNWHSAINSRSPGPRTRFVSLPGALLPRCLAPRRGLLRLDMVAAFGAPAAAIARKVVAAKEAVSAPAPPPAKHRPARHRHETQSRQRERGQPEREHQPGKVKWSLLGRGKKERSLRRRGLVAKRGFEFRSRGHFGGHAQKVQAAHAVSQIDIERLIEGEINAIVDRAHMTAIPEGDIEWEEDQGDECDDLGNQRL